MEDPIWKKMKSRHEALGRWTGKWLPELDICVHSTVTDEIDVSVGERLYYPALTYFLSLQKWAPKWVLSSRKWV